MSYRTHSADLAQRQTGCEQLLLCSRFRYFLTLLAECFAPFDRSTCAPSVSCRVRVSSQRYTRDPQATGSSSPTLEDAAKGRRTFRPSHFSTLSANIAKGVFTRSSLRELISSSWNVAFGEDPEPDSLPPSVQPAPHMVSAWESPTGPRSAPRREQVLKAFFIRD